VPVVGPSSAALAVVLVRPDPDGEVQVSVSRPWKALERRHAKRMRGERLWRQDFSEVAPDGENPDEIWDTKCFKRFSVVELFLRCESKYKAFANGRRFTLVLFSREHPKAGDFVLLRASDYAADQAALASLRSRKTAVRDDDAEEWA
jgi:hypothetical protein